MSGFFELGEVNSAILYIPLCFKELTFWPPWALMISTSTAWMAWCDGFEFGLWQGSEWVVTSIHFEEDGTRAIVLNLYVLCTSLDIHLCAHTHINMMECLFLIFYIIDACI